MTDRAPENGARVASAATGRTGTVINRAGPDAVQVEWDDGSRGVVPWRMLERPGEGG